MKNQAAETTELVFILDRSGSMGGLESDTIGGFNSVIEKQKKIEGAARVTTVLFDDKVELLHDRVDLATIAPMTSKDYFVRGCTALLDAVGSTVKRINKTQKASAEGRPDHTIVVIITDGMENASRQFTFDQVRKLIERRESKNGWEFMFMGANMDAIAAAGSIGIHADRAATFVNDSIGQATVYAACDMAMTSMRCGCAPGAEWKDSIEKDYAKRG